MPSQSSATTKGRLWATTVTQPEPIPPATRARLIELACVEKVYRMAIFPPRNVALACAGTVALALLIALLPIWPAVALRPGDALRSA